MKAITILSLLVLLTSCGSNPMKQRIEAQQELIEDTIKEDKIIGDSLPSWIEESGIENGMVYTVGHAEYNVENSSDYVLSAAKMNAQVKLISDAPSDFRIVTQNALKGAGINTSEYFSIQTKLQEVIGLTGVSFDESKKTCRKVIRYQTYDTKIVRSCWIKAFVPFKELRKAYARTIALKYSTEEADRFNRKMRSEVDKVNYGSLSEQRRRKDEQRNYSNNLSNN